MGKGYDTGANKIIVKTNPTEEQLKTFNNIKDQLVLDIEAARLELSDIRKSIEFLTKENQRLIAINKQIFQSNNNLLKDHRTLKISLNRQLDIISNNITIKQIKADKIKTDYQKEKKEIEVLIWQNEDKIQDSKIEVVKLQGFLDNIIDQGKRLTEVIKEARFKKQDAIEHKLRFDKDILQKTNLLEEQVTYFKKLKKETHQNMDTLATQRSILISEEAKLNQKKRDIADLERREQELAEGLTDLKIQQERLEDQAELQNVKNLQLNKREKDVRVKEKLIKEVFKTTKGGKDEYRK